MTKRSIESVRKWLKCYRLNVKEIQARTEHIQWLKSDIYAPLQESGRGRDQHTAKKIDKIMSDILRDAVLRLNELKYEVEIIEKEIARLDSFERCVLYNRYILGTPWIDLPERVGYEIAQCQRIERRALLQLAQSPRVQQFLDKDSSAFDGKPVDYLAFGKCATIV